MSSLSHHGIKGQRWGVRRFQNKDGTRTAAGKRRNFENETSRVINKLSNEPKPIKRRPFDKDKVRQRGLLTKVEADQCAELAAGLYKNAEQVEPKITGDVIRVVSSTSAKMYGLEHRLKQPTSIAAKIGSDAKGDGVSFEEAASGIKDTIRYTAVSDSRDYVDTYNAIKQRLRDNGYEETKCKNYFQKYQNGEVLHKAVQSTFKSPDGIDFEFQFQTPESQAAKELKLPIYNERRKAGNTPERNAHLEQEMRNLAELVPDPEGVFSIQSHSEVKNIKHTSIGGTMYIEGNALILGDSSYLEHHGIRGQRWGVRRFQNRDGSLTNAGRKRLGYATKGAVQTVKKAFKAGVKTGGKAIKAVKAHHEKKEAEKLEKKKEKASKTRAGVSANKDLFTAKELKELNAKFEEQDKLTMARIKRGVEIAKAVGETAKSVGEVGKAYEALTGHKLVPDIVTLQNGGSIDFGNKDKDSKDKDNKAAKDKDSKDTKDKDDGNPPEHNGSDDKPKGNDVKGSKWDGSDLRNQMEAAKKQASKAMKNAKLQEYIDAYNRDQNSEKNKELTARGQKAIEILSKGGGFTSEEPKPPTPPTPPTPKAAPSSNNLMAQIRAAQAKLEKPNKNETPAEHKEAQKKLNALEKVANEYKAAANKPGADPAEITEKLLKKNKDILDDIKHMDFSDTDYLEHYGVRGMKWQNSTSGKYHHMMRHYGIQNGVLFVDSSDYLSHHGVKGQRWGVRRFQNEDGTLTDKGRKHYEKAIAKLDRKQTNSDALRGRLERMHPFAVTASAVLVGSAYAALLVASAANPATIALGSAVAAAVSALGTHVDYSVAEAWEARGTKRRQKKRKEYEEMLNHDGIYHIENGTLFINAGEPYLEHHGVKGMKWGKHLMAGKGEAGAGGGSGEDDEKLKEMAKKAGMSVAEYRTKMAGKLSGAASKVGSAVYDAAGGSHKKSAEEYQKLSRDASNEARKYEASGNADLAKAASARRKGNTSAHSSYKTTGDNAKDEARKARERASALSEGAKQERATYEKSLAGKYDKMKADRARKKSIKQRQSVERALSNGPVEAKPKKGLGKRLEEKLGVTHEKTNKPKQSKEAKRIEGMFKNAARKEKTFSGTSPKAKKAVIAKKKATPTPYEKRINDAKNSVEKAARSNEAAYKHATEVYRQTGRDSDAYRQAIKRSQTTLWRSLDNQERLKQKKRRPADIGKKRAKHFDDTNAIYTEGTRLVINSKWG